MANYEFRIQFSLPVKIFFGAVILFLLACGSADRYEVVDSMKSVDGKDKLFFVFSPDTNWEDMEIFSKKLLSGYNTASSVLFFYPKNKAPSFDTINRTIKGDWNHPVGIYKCENKDGIFNFYRFPMGRAAYYKTIKDN